MQIQHQLSDPWKSYLQGIQRNMAQARQSVMVLKGQIADLERGIDTRKAEASNLVSLIVLAEQLPPSAEGYTLSDDGACLIGRMADPTENSNA